MLRRDGLGWDLDTQRMHRALRRPGSGVAAGQNRHVWPAGLAEGQARGSRCVDCWAAGVDLTPAAGVSDLPPRLEGLHVCQQLPHHSLLCPVQHLLAPRVQGRAVMRVGNEAHHCDRTVCSCLQQCRRGSVHQKDAGLLRAAIRRWHQTFLQIAVCQLCPQSARQLSAATECG